MTLLRLASRNLVVIIGAFFLVAGIVLFVTGVRDALRERRFEKTGVAVSAVVVSKSIARASRNANSSTRYEIAYRFLTDDGRPVEGVDVVDVEEWERLEPGRPFKVTYLPGAPEASRAEGSGGIAGALIMTGLGIVFTLVGGTLFVVTGRDLLRAWRLLRTGQATRGSVIAIRETNVSVNRRQQWEIRYRYEDHLGRTHEGTSGPVPPHEAEAYTEGDAIDVRFDRAAPEHSVWVPPAEAPAKTGAAVSAPTRRGPLATLWMWVRNVVFVLVIVFVAAVVGESVPELKAFDRAVTRYEGPLLALTVAMTFIGFALFMGGIVYRIFFSAGSGASTSESFTFREAKEAWRRRAWRTSTRWRSNFIVMTGVLLFATGLFGIFAVTGPAAIKLMVAAVFGYAALRTIGAFARA